MCLLWAAYVMPRRQMACDADVRQSDMFNELVTFLIAEVLLRPWLVRSEVKFSGVK